MGAGGANVAAAFTPCVFPADNRDPSGQTWIKYDVPIIRSASFQADEAAFKKYHPEEKHDVFSLLLILDAEMK